MVVMTPFGILTEARSDLGSRMAVLILNEPPLLGVAKREILGPRGEEEYVSWEMLEISLVYFALHWVLMVSLYDEHPSHSVVGTSLGDVYSGLIREHTVDLWV